MKSLWNLKESKKYKGPLGPRVYSSRLLGADPTLTLHGGGNTSVKLKEKDILGNYKELLYVKGSGWDLATIEAPGFSPVDLNHLIALSTLEELSDSEMVNQMRTHLTQASAPTPSVEAILHAILPHKYVDHTHADAVISIMNSPDGKKIIDDLYAEDTVFIPYVMPGFELSKCCADIYPKEVNDKTIGMMLMNHGVFSFGKDARESYERMIDLVSKAEAFLKRNKAWAITAPKSKIKKHSFQPERFSKLRSDISKAASCSMVIRSHTNSESLGYVQDQAVKKYSQQGPLTPDHVIRTKRIPLIGRNVDSYTKQYQKYFDKISSKLKGGDSLTMLDPAPRVILTEEEGLITAGKNIKEVNISADIYNYTIQAIKRSEKLGGFKALPQKEIFRVEYWELEQAKLAKSSNSPEFTGEVVIVTGAASGIGKACVDKFLSQGACVVGLDLNKSIEKIVSSPNYLGIQLDITNEKSLEKAVAQTIQNFGGIDILVLNAGIFPPSCSISKLSSKNWKKVEEVNFEANLNIMRICHQYLKLAYNGGRIAIIGSKNVPAPGPGAAAYSVSKAALNQLARVAALEWGQDNIRINSVHPNAVFDTALWTDEIIETRAKSYGLSSNEYKTNNLLKTEIGSSDVAELVISMCGKAFSCTTAAQVPIDGGNDRVV